MLMMTHTGLQLGNAPGATPAQIRTAKAEFEEQYAQLPSPQWRLLGEAQRSADVVLSGLEDRVRREEASRAAASAADADRRLQQVCSLGSAWLACQCMNSASLLSGLEDRVRREEASCAAASAANADRRLQQVCPHACAWISECSTARSMLGGHAAPGGSMQLQV